MMGSQDIKGRFCSLSEAARIIGLSEVTVKYHVDQGHIEATRDPVNHRLLLRTSVEEFARKRQRQRTKP
jgi:excisionase family DNA binding protein